MKRGFISLGSVSAIKVLIYGSFKRTTSFSKPSDKENASDIGVKEHLVKF
jgi:hypothetical protein